MEKREQFGTKKERKPIEILSLLDMSFVRGGDGEGDPPPVENGGGENG